MWFHSGLNQGPPDYESGELCKWAVAFSEELERCHNICYFTVTLKQTKKPTR